MKLTKSGRVDRRKRAQSAVVVIKKVGDSAPDLLTQARLAELHGVTQRTIGNWLDIPNSNVSNGYKPDARVKLSPAAWSRTCHRHRLAEYT